MTPAILMLINAAHSSDNISKFYISIGLLAQLINISFNSLNRTIVYTIYLQEFPLVAIRIFLQLPKRLHPRLYLCTQYRVGGHSMFP